MIKADCICGAELHLPAAYVDEAFVCKQCGQKWRVAVGGEAADGERAHWALRVESKAHHNERVALAGSGPIEAGKSAGKSLYLPGTLVSRNHCRLMRSGDSWRIEDQHSANGVFINDSRVAEHELRDGDLITLGEFDLRFVRAGTGPILAEPVGAGAAQEMPRPDEPPAIPPPVVVRSGPQTPIDLVDLPAEMEKDHAPKRTEEEPGR